MKQKKRKVKTKEIESKSLKQMSQFSSLATQFNEEDFKFVPYEYVKYIERLIKDEKYFDAIFAIFLVDFDQFLQPVKENLFYVNWLFNLFNEKELSDYCQWHLKERLSGNVNIFSFKNSFFINAINIFFIKNGYTPQLTELSSIFLSKFSANSNKILIPNRVDKMNLEELERYTDFILETLLFLDDNIKDIINPQIDLKSLSDTSLKLKKLVDISMVNQYQKPFILDLGEFIENMRMQKKLYQFNLKLNSRPDNNICELIKENWKIYNELKSKNSNLEQIETLVNKYKEESVANTEYYIITSSFKEQINLAFNFICFILQSVSLPIENLPKYPNINSIFERMPEVSLSNAIDSLILGKYADEEKNIYYLLDMFKKNIGLNWSAKDLYDDYLPRVNINLARVLFNYYKYDFFEAKKVFDIIDNKYKEKTHKSYFLDHQSFLVKFYYLVPLFELFCKEGDKFNNIDFYANYYSSLLKILENSKKAQEENFENYPVFEKIVKKALERAKFLNNKFKEQKFFDNSAVLKNSKNKDEDNFLQISYLQNLENVKKLFKEIGVLSNELFKRQKDSKQQKEDKNTEFPITENIDFEKYKKYLLEEKMKFLIKLNEDSYQVDIENLLFINNSSCSLFNSKDNIYLFFHIENGLISEADYKDLFSVGADLSAHKIILGQDGFLAIKAKDKDSYIVSTKYISITNALNFLKFVFTVNDYKTDYELKINEPVALIAVLDKILPSGEMVNYYEHKPNDIAQKYDILFTLHQEECYGLTTTNENLFCLDNHLENAILGKVGQL